LSKEEGKKEHSGYKSRRRKWEFNFIDVQQSNATAI
jgi:hypothetical protein